MKKPFYVDELPVNKQNIVKKELTKIFQKEGFSKSEVKQYVQDGLDSKIFDLPKSIRNKIK